jgi:catecholate siderophore receptor
LNLRADFATGGVQHNLSTGLELTHEDQDVHTVVATGTRPAANLYNPDWNDAGTLTWARNGAGNDGQTDTTALYLFDSMTFDERFIVTAGLRSDHYKTYYKSRALCTTVANSTAPCGALPVGTIVQNVNLDGSGTLFNWKLGAVFKPIETLSLYANYALAQQPPGGSNFQLSSTTVVCPTNNQPACTGLPAGTVVVNANANNPNLDPQKTHTFELGGKWNVLENRLALNLAVFKTKVTNEINTLLLDENNNPTQTGEKEVKGVEVSVVGNITPNWMVSASYSHLNTEVVEGAVVAQDGTQNLTYTPGDGFTTWTTYRLPFGLTLGGGLRHVGGLHRGTDGAAGTPTLTGGYGVLDAVASYSASDKLALRLNAYNLTDKQYVASINKSGYRYTPGAARTLQLSADYRF